MAGNFQYNFREKNGRGKKQDPRAEMKKCGCGDSAQDSMDSFLKNALTHSQSRTGGKSADLQQNADAAKADKNSAQNKCLRRCN